MAVWRCGAAIVLAFVLCSPVLAQQAPPDRRAFVALKAGTMHENAEDGLRQTSAALGLAGGVPFGQRWLIEVELSDNRIASPEHRETLFSIAAIRQFGHGAVQPFLAVGLSFGRNQETVTSCIADRVPFATGGPPVGTIVDCSEPDVRLRVNEAFSGGTTFLLAGGGVAVPIGARLRVTPEIRVHLSPVAVIVRPAVGLTILF